ncbi:hypothetical protein CTAYLR_007221 [Chrysophaeum taylorii]|uniref:Adaptor protein ClpS core domain-containing protein n=1 Tax=Chrysophaeum taylorii TaxID=2483200 RepID=A0AAD7UAI9_9STRA|nr:hypothetical protein CTAYLR_007221 [Chrysophaeum taylorii]
MTRARWILLLCTQAVALVPTTLRRDGALSSALPRRTPTVGLPTMMAEEKERKTKKGKVAVITKEKTGEAVQVKPKEQLDQEGYWRLLLHNDDVHTFEYVTWLIMTTVPNVSRSKAFHLTMITHTEGVSTVTQTAKPMAMKYCMQLQKGGLTASISPDGAFRDNRESGDGGGGDGPPPTA